MMSSTVLLRADPAFRHVWKCQAVTRWEKNLDTCFISIFFKEHMSFWLHFWVWCQPSSSHHDKFFTCTWVDKWSTRVVSLWVQTRLKMIGWNYASLGGVLSAAFELIPRLIQYIEHRYQALKVRWYTGFNKAAQHDTMLLQYMLMHRSSSSWSISPTLGLFLEGHAQFVSVMHALTLGRTLSTHFCWLSSSRWFELTGVFNRYVQTVVT